MGQLAAIYWYLGLLRVIKAYEVLPRTLNSPEVERQNHGYLRTCVLGSVPVFHSG